MTITETLSRLGIQLLLLAVFMALLIKREKSPDRGLYLLFPFIYGIPGVLLSVFVFAPLEGLLASHGQGNWIWLGVPLVAVLAFPLVLGIRQLLRPSPNTLGGGLWILSGMSLIWSLLWLLAIPIYRMLSGLG